jgi:hypothetical protein
VNPVVVVVHETKRDGVGVIQFEVTSFFAGIVAHSRQRSGVARDRNHSENTPLIECFTKPPPDGLFVHGW